MLQLIPQPKPSLYQEHFSPAYCNNSKCLKQIEKQALIQKIFRGGGWIAYAREIFDHAQLLTPHACAFNGYAHASAEESALFLENYGRA